MFPDLLLCARYSIFFLLCRLHVEVWIPQALNLIVQHDIQHRPGCCMKEVSNQENFGESMTGVIQSGKGFSHIIVPNPELEFQKLSPR